MKNPIRNIARPGIAILSIAFAGTASAGIPVTDIVNDISNIYQNIQLKKLTNEIASHKEGTIYNYTKNIDEQTNNLVVKSVSIDNSTKNIDKSTTKINASTQNIDKSTANIDVITTNNYVIDADFTWIINENGNEIIPIPDPVVVGRDEIRGKKSTEEYIANFKSAAEYKGHLSDDYLTSGLDGSRARKSANDMLSRSLDAQVKGLEAEAAALTKLAEISNSAQGHGRQLQVANALAGSQIDQTMKLRSLLLASEEARAAEAHALADKDARSIATGKRLREGLSEAIRKSTPRSPTY